MSYLAGSGGSYLGEISINDRKSPALNFKISIYPSLTNPYRTRIFGDAASEGVSGKAELFYIQACDMFGNERHFGGDKFLVVLRPLGIDGCNDSLDNASENGILSDHNGLDNDSLNSVDLSLSTTKTNGISESFQRNIIGVGMENSVPSLSHDVTPKVTDLGDGRHEVEYRVTRSGPFRLLVFYVFELFGASQSIPCGNTMLVVMPNKPCPQRSIVTGSGLAGVSPQAVGIVGLIVADAWRNLRSLNLMPYERLPCQPGNSRKIEDFQRQSRTSQDFRNDTLQLHVGEFSTILHCIEAALLLVVDGRERPGGVVSVGEACGIFQSWFERTLLKDALRNGSQNLNDCAVKVYAISYRPKQAGIHHLIVKLNGEHVSGSPFILNIRPIPAHKRRGKADEACGTEIYDVRQDDENMDLQNWGFSAHGVEKLDYDSAGAAEREKGALTSIDFGAMNIAGLRDSGKLISHTRGRRRAGFSRQCHSAPSGEITLSNGKSVMVFGDWSRGASHLVSQQLAMGRSLSEQMEDVETKRRFAWKRHSDFLKNQIQGFLTQGFEDESCNG